jgi:hypothetical protein
MIELVRKPTPLTAFELVDQAAMLEALTFLAGEGWRGALSPEDGVWVLELNADNPTRQVIADLGEWLILDGGLRKLSAAEVDADYEVSS